jgi:hypothetical protein
VRELHHGNLEDNLERIPSQMIMHLNIQENDLASILLLKRLREYQSVHEDDQHPLPPVNEELHVNQPVDNLENNLNLDPHLNLMLGANLNLLTQNVHQLHKDHLN